MEVPAQVHQLVERFDANLDDYKNGRFSEAQVRVDFIDPLLKHALGWDVHNEKDLPEAYREVVYEDRVKVGVGQRPRTTASTPADSAGSFWRRRSLRSILRVM
jgi:hypothetical protein